MALARPLVAALLVFGLVGCSRTFWERPRVGGVQSAPYAAAPYAAAPAPQAALPAPQVRSVAPTAPPTFAPAPMQTQTPPSTYAPPMASGPAPQPWTGAAPLSAGDGSTPTQEERAILAHVNAIRASRSLRALTWSGLLYRAARDHSMEQSRHGYMGHGSPDPNRRTLVQRMLLAGYNGSMYGEVVAWGYRDPQAVVEGWMNSPEHREILVDGQLAEVGFARVGQYWTGNFGALSAPGPSYRPPQTPAPRAAAPVQRTPYVPAPSVRVPSPRPAPAAVPAPVAPAPRQPVQRYFAAPAPRRAPTPTYRPPARGG